MKNVLLVHNTFHNRAELAENILDDDLLNPEPDLARCLSQESWNVEMVRVEGSIRQALAPYDPTRWIIFNLIEEWWGWTIGGARAPRLYESLGFAYTGSDAAAQVLTTRKDKMKECLGASDVPTPRYRLFRRQPEPWPYRFPAFVKPAAECGSMGIERASVVRNQAELDERVERVIRRYRQPALVEEFVQGRELMVGVWGDGVIESLPPLEINFARIPDPLQRINSFDAKWIRTSDDYQNTPLQCPASLDPQLGKQLADIGVRTFRALGLRDYARIDVRVGEEGPMVIDVNANPALYEDCEFPREAAAAGYAAPKMLDRIASWTETRRRQASSAGSQPIFPLRKLDRGDIP